MKGSVKLLFSFWITLGIYLYINADFSKHDLKGFLFIVHCLTTFVFLLADLINYTLDDPNYIGKYNPINIVVKVVKYFIHLADKHLTD